MWFASPANPTGTGGSDLWQYLLPALLVFTGVIVTATVSLRGTFKTAATSHETEFDRRVDARARELEAQVTALADRLAVRTDELYHAREVIAEMRLAMIRAGLDPDHLGGADNGSDD